MRPSRSDFAGWALTALAIVALAASGCHGKPGSAKPKAGAAQASTGDARTVRVVTVRGRGLEGGLTASGVLISREEAQVGSELGGYRIAKVYAERGDWVRQGQPMVQLDDTLLRAQLAQQTALAAQADAQAKRVSGLEGEGVLSTEQIETRRFQAQVQDAALNELKTRQARMTIRAPVSGIVLDRNVWPGQIASAGGGTPMFTMARDGLIELNAEVPEADLFHIKPGDPVTVTLPDTTSLPGKVRLIDPQVDAQTKLGHVRVALPVNRRLRPGGFGRATFTGVTQASLTVPETAVRYDADGASVMVLGANNRVRQVEVTTGRRSNGYVELLKGPPDGAKVLLGAASFVLPGDQVKPIDADTAGAQAAK